MEREPNELVELGTVTDDTAGNAGPPFEPAGRTYSAGIEQD